MSSLDTLCTDALLVANSIMHCCSVCRPLQHCKPSTTFNSWMELLSLLHAVLQHSFTSHQFQGRLQHCCRCCCCSQTLLQRRWPRQWQQPSAHLLPLPGCLPVQRLLHSGCKALHTRLYLMSTLLLWDTISALKDPMMLLGGNPATSV